MTTEEYTPGHRAVMRAVADDDLPVSALPVDGSYPSGTTAFEKRDIPTSASNAATAPSSARTR